MKLTTGILAVAIMTGAAWAQNPVATDNAHSTAKSLAQSKTNQGSTVMVAAAVAPQTKPAPGAPAPAIKPAPIPEAKAAASEPSQNNTLEQVNVVHNADDIQIKISSREAVTPKVSKLSSPARVVVELPATAMATPQNKIAVGSAGVKGVRIGMDGKTPPTTSVVVDLEKACAYDITPGVGNSLVLTLHTQAVATSATAAVPAKSSAPVANAVPVPSKSAVVAAKPIIAAVKPTAALPAASAARSQPSTVATAVKAPDPFVSKKPMATPARAPEKVAAAKTAPAKTAAPKIVSDKVAATPAAPATKIAAIEKPADSGKAESAASKTPKPEEKKWAMTGKRDPFFSPVVQQSGGSGCSTGKKCLEIGQINVRGVVKSDSGFIAVVTNGLNKAYFLHENDPVFNGFVVRITGDSVVFQETVQDKLGKSLTREVVKRIVTPAV